MTMPTQSHGGLDESSRVILNDSGRPVIVVFVRRIVRPVEDCRAAVIAGKRYSVPDTSDQILGLNQIAKASHFFLSDARTGL